MQITIEHETARKVASSQWLKSGKVIHPLTIERQKLSNWCWAAIACSIARFYNRGSYSQENIVSHTLDIALSEHDVLSDSHSSNQQTTLDKALSYVNCFSHWSLGRPSFERLSFEVMQGGLPCIRIEWLSGGAHYLVLKGINPEEGSITLDDPKFGETVIPYQHFPKRYVHGSGLWTDTFWTIRKNT